MATIGTVEIQKIEATASGVVAQVAAPGGPTTISIRSDEPLDPAEGDAVFCLTLLLAMRGGGTSLHIPAVVSERLLGSAFVLSEIFRRWIGPGTHPISVTAAGRASVDRVAGRAAFFSCGVDSFYTAVTRAGDLDALLFLRGYDIAHAPDGLVQRATERAGVAAAELGLSLVAMDVAVRHLSDPLLSWELYHGSVLAAAAHAAGRWGRVLIPATADYRHMAPWGSHPWTDVLWSSDAVELEDDGVWATRLDKITLLADHEVAMRHLRVCWSATGGEYNCGRCAKCLETTLALELIGASGRCATLPSGIDVRAWEQLQPKPTEVIRLAARVDRPVGHLRDLLEAGADAHPVGAELRRLLRPYDRLEEDPAALDSLGEPERAEQAPDGE